MTPMLIWSWLALATIVASAAFYHVAERGRAIRLAEEGPPRHPPQGATLGQAYMGTGALLGGLGLGGACLVACLAAGPLGWLAGIVLVPLAFCLGAALGGVLMLLLPLAALLWALVALQ